MTTISIPPWCMTSSRWTQVAIWLSSPQFSKIPSGGSVPAEAIEEADATQRKQAANAIAIRQSLCLDSAGLRIRMPSAFPMAAGNTRRQAGQMS
jgi:hypothetical protein